jgi:hypothetical protein
MKSVVVCVCLLSAGLVSAQTAGQLDGVLGAEAVTFGQAAGIILPAAGLLEPEAGGEAAFARARDWLPRGAEREAPIRMGELARLVMGAFGLSGGLLYALFPGPRYAYRALAWGRLLPLRADPYRRVTGEELLYLTGRVLAHTGEAEPVFALSPAAPVPPAGPAGEAPEGLPLRVEQGQGVSGGAEGVLPYQEEFEVE